MKTRRTCTPIRIDFTPFVSVALLLIVFFVWMKMVQRPNAMQMNIPGGFICYYGEYPLADANLFLLATNRIDFLNYQPNDMRAELVEIDYSAEGLRKQLTSISLNHEYGAIVLITPTEQTMFKNLVDVLDELRIVGNLRFVLNYSLTSEEREMLKRYKECRTRWKTTEQQCGHQVRTDFICLYKMNHRDALATHER